MLNFMINELQNEELTVSMFEKVCYYYDTWNFSNLGTSNEYRGEIIKKINKF